MHLVALRVGIGLCSLILFLAACDATPGLPETEGTPAGPLRSHLHAGPPGRGRSGRRANRRRPAHTRSNCARPGRRGFAASKLRRPLAHYRSRAASDGHAASHPRRRGGAYRASTTLRVSTAEVGVYTIRVLAVDEAGLTSNQVIGSLLLTADGRPPVIEEVIVPGAHSAPEPRHDHAHARRRRLRSGWPRQPQQRGLLEREQSCQHFPAPR